MNNITMSVADVASPPADAVTSVEEEEEDEGKKKVPAWPTIVGIMLGFFIPGIAMVATYWSTRVQKKAGKDIADDESV